MKPTKEIKKAYEIAVANLKSNYNKNGILAGSRQFSDYWARDSFFASFGALEIGDFDVVKKNLSFFLKYTKSDGTVPLRIGNYNILPKILRSIFRFKFKDNGLRSINKKINDFSGDIMKNIRARYRNDRNKNFPIDSNSLLIISFYYYVKRTGDKKFAKENFHLLEKILIRSLKRDSNLNLLLENVFGGSWDDSLNIMGESIYTNVCHFASVMSFWKIAKLIGKNAKKYEDMYKEIKSKINKNLWNGKYYNNFISNDGCLDIFSMAGNILSIHWHLADKNKALSIEKFIDESDINKYVPSMTNCPKYPSKFVSYMFRLLGIGDYHNMGMCWLWLGAEDAIVKYKIGNKKKALEIMKKMSEVIVRYNSVYEVYETNGEPVKRRFYKSENSFAWSSGLFVMAYNVIFSNNKKNVLDWEFG